MNYKAPHKFLAALLSLGLFLTLPFTASAATFSDVGTDEIYKTGIEFLESEGIVQGYADGTFKPLQTLNRAEMLKIIAEGAASYRNWPDDTFNSYASKSCFNDVAANQWYTKYVCYGKEKGWIVGYDGGKYFKPTQEVTFVEGLKIAFKGFDLKYTETTTPWYKDVVIAASKQNLIPFDIHAFAAPLQRNQMADLVARMINTRSVFIAVDEAKLEAYLGPRADIVVTYDTIEAGQNLSEMDTVELAP